VLAAIDIHKAVFQAAVLDPGTGALVEQRFAASREALAAWAREWNGRLDAVAIEATTGWRWVAHERMRTRDERFAPEEAWAEFCSRDIGGVRGRCTRSLGWTTSSAGGDSCFSAKEQSGAPLGAPARWRVGGRRQRSHGIAD
jgi:hypothetical protein